MSKVTRDSQRGASPKAGQEVGSHGAPLGRAGAILPGEGHLPAFSPSQIRASTCSDHWGQVPLSLGKFLKLEHPQTGQVGRWDPDMGVGKSGFLSWGHHELLSNVGTQETASQASRRKSPLTGRTGRALTIGTHRLSAGAPSWRPSVGGGDTRTPVWDQGHVSRGRTWGHVLDGEPSVAPMASCPLFPTSGHSRGLSLAGWAQQTPPATTASR